MSTALVRGDDGGLAVRHDVAPEAAADREIGVPAASIAQLLGELQALRADVAELRKAAATTAAPKQWPAELTLKQALEFTNHKSTSAFFRWAKRRHVRSLNKGRYSRRRLEMAMSA